MDTNSKYYIEVINIVKRLEEQEYLSEEWISIYEHLNELIYEVYDINISEINLIEDYMKEIQSKRWFDKNGR